jgi:hypothetical protein
MPPRKKKQRTLNSTGFISNIANQRIAIIASQAANSTLAISAIAKGARIEVIAIQVATATIPAIIVPIPKPPISRSLWIFWHMPGPPETRYYDPDISGLE